MVEVHIRKCYECPFKGRDWTDGFVYCPIRGTAVWANSVACDHINDPQPF